MPFEEIAHTADWAIQVWAEDLGTLLTESARGMYTLANAVAGPGPRVKRELSLEAVDAESLLVTFLEELLYLAESEGLLFDRFTFTNISETKIHAIMEGQVLHSQDKEIKAVTFHNLEIRKSERGLEVEIVFDV